MDKFFGNFDIRRFSTLGKSNVISSNAMLASSHPIASSAGLDVLVVEEMRSMLQLL